MQVGSEVARRAKGLGFSVIAYDPYASEAKAAAMGVRLVTFDEALASGDFFSLHMPLTPDTKVQLQLIQAPARMAAKLLPSVQVEVPLRVDTLGQAAYLLQVQLDF